MIGNEAVDEALSTEYTAKKLQDLRSMSREEYIKEYGDVFESSINILNLPDSEFLGAELTDSEKRLLEEFEKKTKHKNYIFSTSIDLIYELFNFDRKLNNSILSKSVKFIGRNPSLNKIFTKIADEGINF